MKYVVSLLIALVALSTISMTIVGAEQKNSGFKLREVEGEFIKNKNTDQSIDNVYLNHANISQEDGIVNGKGSLVINGVKIPLSLNGKMYPIKGDSPYADQLVLGDMESDKNFNILKFGIKNTGERAMLSIVLEDNKSGEWIRFKEEVSQEVFKAFREGANKLVKNNDMKENDVIKKAIQLFNMHNKSKDKKGTPSHIDMEQKGTADTKGEFSFDAPISTQSWTRIPVNFKELNRMLDDLNDPYTNSVNLTDYNLPESLFKGSGWKQDVDISSPPGSNYYAASAEQIDFTITQLTVFQNDSGFSEWNGNEVDYDIALTYKHGITLEYNHHTKEVSAFMYGLGLTLKNLHIAQGGLEGRNVYYAQTLSGKDLTESGSDVIGYLVGLIPHGSKVTDLWSVLSTSKNTTLGNRERFIGKTYEDQKGIHEGDVYRVSSGVLSNWNFDRKGASVNLLSEIHSGDGYVNLRWNFRATVSSNL